MMRGMAIGLLFILALLLAVAEPVQTYEASAPELFGDGTAMIAKIDTLAIGIILNADLVFFLRGYVKGQYINGNIVQIAGPHVDNYGEMAPIPFRMAFRGGKFSGWIFFRGHERKFCGGRNGIPGNCMLRER